MDENYIKISFTGDIMCEAIQINSHKVKDKYYFLEVFCDKKDYFNESDYVVANLETPIVDGSELEYCNNKLSFNVLKKLKVYD